MRLLRRQLLADKEKYAPWSGSPMSGRIDLSWNGRDITIERATKGRAIFGDFHAYETATGLPVSELNAANCGELLLGVEKSVFLRAGFLKLTDLAVTDDDSLRRRLNALVTTGDESGASDALEQKLRDLKNRCRYNKSGLLPQAQAQRTELSDKLEQLRQLRLMLQRTQLRQKELDVTLKQLQNHKTALAYTASLENARRVELANTQKEEAYQALEAQKSICAPLPPKEQTQQTLRDLEALQTQILALESEVLPPEPATPSAPSAFIDMTPEQAVQQAEKDKASYDIHRKGVSPVLLILALLLLAGAAGLSFIQWMFALPLLLASVILLWIYCRRQSVQKKQSQEVFSRYKALSAEEWVPLAQQYRQNWQAYQQAIVAHQALSDSFAQRKQSLEEKVSALTQGAQLTDYMHTLHSTLDAYAALGAAQHRWEQASSHAKELAAVANVAQPPAFADTLNLNAVETEKAYADALAEHQQLIQLAGQYQGQMEALGQETTLEQQLAATDARIDQLEDTYAALTIALETLSAAENDLQRKFAPRIAHRAQTLLGKLTKNRYDRLLLGEDFSVTAGAENETTLHSSLWRSDGTIDQLYLVLRLAVAEELTPNAPLVLDDALVRFDDSRLATAMDILKDTAQQKQVILFSCQKRESVHTEY